MRTSTRELAELDRELGDPHMGIRRGLGHASPSVTGSYRLLSLEVQRREMTRASRDRVEIDALAGEPLVQRGFERL